MKPKLILMMTIIFSLSLFNYNEGIKAQGQQATQIAGSIIEAVNQIDIVSLNVLLASDADIEAVDGYGNTPLMLASKIGNLRMFRIIMAHNPNINARNKFNETALMIAAEHGQAEIVRILLQNGANRYVRNQSGLTPAELARRNGHSQIINLLRDPNETPLSR